MDEGQRGDYQWLVIGELRTLRDLVLGYHDGLHLWVTSFDGGPLELGEEEKKAGWATVGPVSVSPPLRTDLDLPWFGYDEWYLAKSPVPPSSGMEVFVNYAGFSLATSEDWLRPIQDRFWQQIESIRPVSYVAMGDYDVVVTLNAEFLEAIRAQAV